MPEQLDQQRLELIADIVGGLLGSQVYQLLNQPAQKYLTKAEPKEGGTTPPKAETPSNPPKTVQAATSPENPPQPQVTEISPETPSGTQQTGGAPEPPPPPEEPPEDDHVSLEVPEEIVPEENDEYEISHSIDPDTDEIRLEWREKPLSFVQKVDERETQLVAQLANDREYKAFIQNIQDSPQDQEGWFVLADWLEEHGATTTAENIRVWDYVSREAEENVQWQFPNGSEEPLHHFTEVGNELHSILPRDDKLQILYFLQLEELARGRFDEPLQYHREWTPNLQYFADIWGIATNIEQFMSILGSARTIIKLNVSGLANEEDIKQTEDNLTLAARSVPTSSVLHSMTQYLRRLLEDRMQEPHEVNNQDLLFNLQESMGWRRAGEPMEVAEGPAQELFSGALSLAQGYANATQRLHRQKSLKPSPFGPSWFVKGRPPTQTPKVEHQPTVLRAHQVHGPQAGSVKGPKAPNPYQSAAGMRPDRPLMESPPQPTARPEVPPPQDQGRILDQIKEQLQGKGDNVGTNLAHWLRTHRTDPSVLDQYQAAGVADLNTLTEILNKNTPPANVVPLPDFHDDNSPFAVLSEPGQGLGQGGIPAVVVGAPYEGVVHKLEEAFPGVHFMSVNEAPRELEEAARMLGKPLPVKSLRIKSSPFGPSWQTKAEPDKPTTPAPTNQSPSKAPKKEPKPSTQAKPQQGSQQGSQRGTGGPLTVTSDGGSGLVLQRRQPPAQLPPTPEPEPGIPFAAPFDPQQAPTQTEDFGAGLVSESHIPGFHRSGRPDFLANEEDVLSEPLEPFEEEAPDDKDLYVVEMGKIGKRLKQGSVVDIQPNNQRGINSSWRVKLESGLDAIFKPGVDEHPGWRGEIVKGTLYSREVIASIVANLMGWGDLVPETVARYIRFPDGEKAGSMQKWVSRKKSPFDFLLQDGKTVDPRVFGGEDKLARAAAFDYLLGQSDRRLANLLVGSVCIDNGTCLPNGLYRLSTLGRLRDDNYIQHQATRLRVTVPKVNPTLWARLSSVVRFFQLDRDPMVANLGIELMKYRYRWLLDGVGKPFSDLRALNGDQEDMKSYFARGPEIEKRMQREGF